VRQSESEHVSSVAPSQPAVARGSVFSVFNMKC